MTNRGEIRGLPSGVFTGDNGDCLLDVYTHDDGIHIVHIDFEMDIFYHWTIDPNGQVAGFFIGSVITGESY